MQHPMGPSRRTALAAAAWSVPVATVAAAAPAFAISPTTSTGVVAWGAGTSPFPHVTYDAPASGVHVPVVVGAAALTRDAGVYGREFGPDHLDVVTMDASAGLDVLILDLKGPAPGRTMHVGVSFSRAVSNVRIPISGLAVASGWRGVVSVDPAAGSLSIAPEAEPWLSVVTADGLSRVEVIQAGGRGWPLAPEGVAMLHVAGPVTGVQFVFCPEPTSLQPSSTQPPLLQYPGQELFQRPDATATSQTLYLGNISFDVTA